MLATVREYCKINVTTNGAAYLISTLASRCHFFLIFPAETAASHCLLRLSCPSRIDSGSPFDSKADISDGWAVKEGVSASWPIVFRFVLKSLRYIRVKID